MLVTDIKRVLKNGKEVTGYYLNSWLKNNLDDIPRFLEKEWDVVGIVSGRGKVGVGKSTMAAQVGYYLAWRLAGGKMITDEKDHVKEIVKPEKPIRFNLEENVVFSADALQEAANNLYNKYGKRQVIIYDEGRQGLDSKRAMESINKGMEDFFQECRFMSHVIIIVIPNYFKLHEDYAVARSLFLIDVTHDSNYQRGYFNFYNDKTKEKLFFFGKKRIGITAKYMVTKENFWGKFTRWLPFDKIAYEKRKQEELNKKRVLRREKNHMLQRDILIYILNKFYKVGLPEIKEKMWEALKFEIGLGTLEESTRRIKDIILKERGF